MVLSVAAVRATSVTVDCWRCCRQGHLAGLDAEDGDENDEKSENQPESISINQHYSALISILISNL